MASVRASGQDPVNYAEIIRKAALKEYGKGIERFIPFHSQDKHTDLCKITSYNFLAFLPIAPFVGIYKTVESLALALKYNNLLQTRAFSHIQVQRGVKSPIIQPRRYESPIKPVFEGYSPEPVPTETCYLEPLSADEAFLLKEMRNDRLISTLTQGMMTTGMILITVILIVIYLSEPKIYMWGLLAVGITTLVFGGGGYLLNQALRPSNRFRIALRTL